MLKAVQAAPKVLESQQYDFDANGIMDNWQLVRSHDDIITFQIDLNPTTEHTRHYEVMFKWSEFTGEGKEIRLTNIDQFYLGPGPEIHVAKMIKGEVLPNGKREMSAQIQSIEYPTYLLFLGKDINANLITGRVEINLPDRRPGIHIYITDNPLEEFQSRKQYLEAGAKLRTQ